MSKVCVLGVVLIVAKILNKFQILFHQNIVWDVSSSYWWEKVQIIYGNGMSKYMCMCVCMRRSCMCMYVLTWVL